MKSLLAALLLAAPARGWDLPWLGQASEFVYEIESTGKPSVDAALSERAALVLRKRLEAFGFSGRVERRDGRIVVSMRGSRDPESVLKPLLKPARLEFRLCFPDKKKPGPGETTLPEYELDPETKEARAVLRVVQERVLLTGADIASAQAAVAELGQPQIAMEFGAAGAAKLAEVTRESIGRWMAISVDGRILSNAVIQSAITGGNLVISGVFTQEETRDMARLLSSGPLPAKLRLVRKTVGGADVPVAAEEPAPPAARPSAKTVQVQPAAEAPAPVSDVDAVPPAVRTGHKGAAVVIGVERTRQGLPRADYAVKDARVFAEYLVKTLGYREQDVVLLLDERAAKSDLEKYLEDWLPKRAGPGASVVVYFSGHGAPDPVRGKAYLVPYDGDPAFLDKTAYPLARLTETLGKLEGRRSVVLIDACFSGAGRRSTLAKGARPLVTKLEEPEPQGDVAVLSAAASDQIGGAYDEKGHGIFTYFILSALREAAAAGRVPDVEELFEASAGRVEAAARRLGGNEQTPQLQAAGAARRNPL
ncbi:MAG TPA: hypothetical protein DCM05_16975 [Elusimicrobia bacterium]|nr:hypothetical protein [Elusimicrobiota bacterium]